MQMNSTYFLARFKPNFFKRLLAYAVVVIATVVTTVLYPPLLIVPLFAASAWTLHYNITFFQKLRHQRIWLTAFSLLMAAGPIFPMARPAGAAFSYLFQISEQVLDQCVLNQFGTIATISAILFGALRISFMVGVGIAGYQIWQRRQQSQDWQEVLNIMLSAVMIVVIIGFVEPLIVGTGAC